MSLTENLSVWCDSLDSIWIEKKVVIDCEDVAAIQLVGGKDGVIVPISPEQQVILQSNGEGVENTAGSPHQNLPRNKEKFVITMKLFCN